MSFPFQSTLYGVLSRISSAERWAADAVSLSRLALMVPLVRFVVAGSPWALAVSTAENVAGIARGAGGLERRPL